MDEKEALVRKVEELSGALDGLARQTYHKCGWDNLGKEGYCGPMFCEHGSCLEALELKAILGVLPWPSKELYE